MGVANSRDTSRTEWRDTEEPKILTSCLLASTINAHAHSHFLSLSQGRKDKNKKEEKVSSHTSQPLSQRLPTCVMIIKKRALGLNYNTKPSPHTIRW